MNNVEQALDQANRCGNEIWRLWHYQAETGVLTLCGYHPSLGGYHPSVAVTEYLHFQSPSYICLPQWLRDARFTLARDGDDGLPVGCLVDSTSSAVLIWASEATFCIVCQGVDFMEVMP